MRQRKQTGIVLIAFVVTALLVTMSALYFMAGWQRQEGELKPAEAQGILIQAKAHILNHAAYVSGNLGYVSHMPDVLALDDTPTPYNYDGDAQTGCIDASWTPNTWGSNGQSTIIVNASGPNSRCFGRFPWRSYGMKFAIQKPNDSLGLVPWIAMSSNLALTGLCLQHRTPLILGARFNPSGFCPTIGPLPLRWLTVLNPNGSVRHSEVAFVLILPGLPMVGDDPYNPKQNRTLVPLKGPDHYLDSFSLTSDLSADSRSNANGFVVSNSANQQYYLLPARNDGATSSAGYQQPYLVNDRVLYVTAEEFLYHMEGVALARLQQALKRYSEKVQHLPNAAPLGGNINGAYPTMQNGLLFGWVPYDELRLVLDPPFGAPGYPASVADKDLFKSVDNLAAGGWFHYVMYAVSANCTAAPLCSNGTLTAGPQANVQALLIGPGRSLGPSVIAVNGDLDSTPAPYLEAANANAPLDGVYEDATRGRTATYNDRIQILKLP